MKFSETFLIAALTGVASSGFSNEHGKQFYFFPKCYETTSTVTPRIKFNISVSNIQSDRYQKIRTKIASFENLTSVDFRKEIPSESSIHIALQIIDVFEDKGVMVQKTSAMADGGVSFEFFNSLGYHAIQIYNDGDIVYLERPTGRDAIVTDMTLDQVKDKLYGIKSYGE